MQWADCRSSVTVGAQSGANVNVFYNNACSGGNLPLYDVPTQGECAGQTEGRARSRERGKRKPTPKVCVCVCVCFV